MLEKTIDMLLIGAKNLFWGIGLVGIPVSIILVFANISNGFGAVALMLAVLFVAIAVTLLLMPDSFSKNLPEGLQAKRFVIGGVLAAIAMIIAGITYFTQGGFPELNLLFTTTSKLN